MLAAITSYIGISGGYALQNFKEDYQDIKDNHLEVLLNIIELKTQVNEVLNITLGMFSTENSQELASEYARLDNKKIWVESALKAIDNKVVDTQDLVDLQSMLYKQTDLVSAALQKKFELSDKLFAQYEQVENYKFAQIKEGKPEVVLTIDRMMSLLTPIVRRDFIEKKKVSKTELHVLLNAIESKIAPQTFRDLNDLFFGPSSFVLVYEDYINQLNTLDLLKMNNAKVSASVIDIIAKKGIAIQKELLLHLHQIEEKLSSRKYKLYSLLLVSLMFTLILIFLQAGFLRRVDLIRKVIDAGNKKSQFDFPIKGKDEITEMAISVKSYIDTLLEKEQEASENNERLKHLASHDGLTNIYNRRYFDTNLTQEHIRYLRYKEPYCLAMLDLDFFKKINDNYGHDIGDKVLIDFTSRVSNQMRETDIFARLGGEEFALLMPRTSETNAIILMERIRNEINSTACVAENLYIKFTVSIGVVEVQKIEDIEDATKQLAFADKALYQAKNSGRNKVCAYRHENNN
jgi:diguanylate cyclase (GGDEF)-like protein